MIDLECAADRVCFREEPFSHFFRDGYCVRTIKKAGSISPENGKRKHIKKSAIDTEKQGSIHEFRFPAGTPIFNADVEVFCKIDGDHFCHIGNLFPDVPAQEIGSGWNFCLVDGIVTDDPVDGIPIFMKPVK